MNLPIPLCVPNAVFFLGVPAPCGAGTHKRIGIYEYHDTKCERT